MLDDGRLVHDHGDTAAPGLYALGRPWQRSRGSALLGFVGRDAADLAERLDAETRRHRRCDPLGPRPSLDLPVLAPSALTKRSFS